MNFWRLMSAAAVACAALLLSGCFVISKNLPAGTQIGADERLVGAWRGFDNDEKKNADAFLHFLAPDKGAPMKLVWVEDRNYQVYEVQTMRIGQKNVFAAKIVTPMAEMRGEIPDGYFVGFYDVKGDDISFNLLDAEKVGALIQSGKVKGIKPPGKYDFATLTGSPTDLARFLASPEASASLAEEPAHLHRLTRAAR